MIYVLRLVVIRCVDILLRLLAGINNYKHIYIIIQYFGMPFSEFDAVSENTLSMSWSTYFACGNNITNKITIFVFIQSFSCACGFNVFAFKGALTFSCFSGIRRIALLLDIVSLNCMDVTIYFHNNTRSAKPDVCLLEIYRQVTH